MGEDIFKIDGNPIPTVEEKKTIKCLGKWFTIDGKDTTIIHDMFDQAETWLKSIRVDSQELIRHGAISMG